MSDEHGRRMLPRRRGAKIYLAGSVFGQACALLRYTVLARLLGPEQLGLVAIIILISNFLEMISDTGSDRFLVQDAEGDERSVQKLVQLVFVGRGLFMALGLALVAYPVSALYEEPALLLGLICMSAAPLIAGFTHLDMRRMQRHNDFRIEGFAVLWSEMLALVVTVAAALITRDFTATIYGLVARSAVVVAVSHAYRQRPYGLDLPKAAAGRLAAFSGPLIANGFLLFVAGQSDRLLVSTLIGVEALGYYSAVLLLILYPSTALTRYFAGIHLPLVSADPTNPARGSASDLMGGRTVVMSIAMAVGFVLIAPFAIVILYGEQFTQPALTIGLIAVLQSGRFIRVWPTTLAMGLARSRIVMINSFVRMLGIPAALVGFLWIGGMEGLVLGFIVGEVAALVSGILMVNQSRGFPWWHDFDRVAAIGGGSALLLCLLASVQEGSFLGMALTIPIGGALSVWIVRREWHVLATAVAAAKRVARRR